MPGIRRANLWNIKVGYHIPKEHDPYADSDPDSYHLRYCQSCLRVGIKSELKRRLYRVKDSKLIREAVPATDADRFRQCYRCGDIVPIYNVKTESALVHFVEPTINPFDDNADKIGFTARTSRLAKKKNKYARKKAQLSSIKDDDLKSELADGQTRLISYTESAS